MLVTSGVENDVPIVSLSTDGHGGNFLISDGEVSALIDKL
jgi:hypothetical protein